MNEEFFEATLPQKVTIQTVSEVNELLLAAYDSGQTVALCSEAVTAIDTAGVQLLLGFLNQMSDDGRELEWKNIASTVREMTSLAGVADLMHFEGLIKTSDDGLCPVF